MALVTLQPVSFGADGYVELVYDDADRLVRTVRPVTLNPAVAITVILTTLASKERVQRIDRSSTGARDTTLDSVKQLQAGEIPKDPDADWPFTLEAHLCRATDFAVKFASL